MIICSPFGISLKVAIPSKSVTAPFSNSSKYTVAPNNGSFSDSEITFICISDVCAFSRKARYNCEHCAQYVFIH